MKLNKRYTKEEVLVKFKDSWNDLFDISLKYNSTKLFDPECTHYIKCYWELFKNLRTKDIKILEIGVKDGDSLKIWRDFFSKGSSIYGIEINPAPLVNFSQINTEIFFGDQTDVLFLNEVIKKTKKVDIIIDDGGHTQDQLKTSFEFLFKYGLKEGGIYIMEDIATSYWYKWSGGLNNKNSIMEFLKQKIDSLNYRFWKGGRNDYVPKPDYKDVDATYWDENIESITFYKGICFIKKGDNKNDEE